MQEAEKKKDYSQITKLLPKLNELVEGTVIEIGRNEIYLDIKGITTGIVRGTELLDESGDFSNLKKGDKISATVMELENEKGLIELSFRSASHKKIWHKLEKIAQEGKEIKVKVTAANKGGLMIKYGKTKGFLPVSQLSNENYPRVEGGDKNKILEELKKFVGQEINVKIINTDEKNNTLIVSEKRADQESVKEITDKYKVGDVVTGTISGLVDFGAFITFDQGREGLIHISELAWRRIDHPQDVVKVGEKIKAEIIDITDQGKISLSVKKITKDPWADINLKYKLGQKVKGKVLKVNPFGLFVELDPLIHGLAHISELSDQPIKNISEFARPGDVLEFTVVSLEPQNHRLGLSLKK